MEIARKAASGEMRTPVANIVMSVDMWTEKWDWKAFQDAMLSSQTNACTEITSMTE